MKVLLLHHEDTLAAPWENGGWDLVIDSARAPASSYEQWGQRLGCPVMSLFQLSREIEDLYEVRNLVQQGHGRMVDALGIDWVEMFGPMLYPLLQDMLLLQRLSQKLEGCSELAASRPWILPEILGHALGCAPRFLQGKVDSRWTRFRHAARNLSPRQIWQIAQDKYDADYAWRRQFAAKPPAAKTPRVLLPSAYVNVSRTEISYARLLPEQKFLLVAARPNAFVREAPQNVEQISLASYAAAPADYRAELRSLEDRWDALSQHLSNREEFRFAGGLGVFARGRALLPWGLALREAWRRVLNAENIVACLSADDSNPASRIPLALAQKRRTPTAACHHGALDFAMAFKQRPYDLYLAKREMERDYLIRVCGVPDSEIRLGIRGEGWGSDRASAGPRPWFVFFTEPYEVDMWRIEEIYREVIPPLVKIARQCARTLVLKLHPFENAKQRSRLLDAILAPGDRKVVEVVDVPVSEEILAKTWAAVTVESTTAVQCAEAGIATFLLGWLRNSQTGYALQYARFGVGHMLKSPMEFGLIPELVQMWAAPQPAQTNPAMSPDRLRACLGWSANASV